MKRFNIAKRDLEIATIFTTILLLGYMGYNLYIYSDILFTALLIWPILFLILLLFPIQILLVGFLLTCMSSKYAFIPLILAALYLISISFGIFKPIVVCITIVLNVLLIALSIRYILAYKKKPTSKRKKDKE